MMDNELAKEYVRNKAYKGNFDLELFGKAYFSESSMEQAYLAGLKAGRLQWHDLRKDPNDLPKDNDEKLCVYKKGKVVARKVYSKDEIKLMPHGVKAQRLRKLACIIADMADAFDILEISANKRGDE